MRGYRSVARASGTGDANCDCVPPGRTSRGWQPDPRAVRPGRIRRTYDTHRGVTSDACVTRPPGWQPRPRSERPCLNGRVDATIEELSENRVRLTVEVPSHDMHHA